MKKQKYKIVKILNEFSIIINGGSMHGIEEGDRFEILDIDSNPVIDPDTNEVIGQLDLIKADVVANRVYEKMTICDSVEKIEGVFADLSASLEPTKQFFNKKQDRLNVDMTQITGGSKYSKSTIKIGDTVRKK